MYHLFSRKIFIYLALTGVIFFAYKAFAFFGPEKAPMDFDGSKKSITIKDNGLEFLASTDAGNVSDALKEENIKTGDHDIISPDINSKIASGTIIEIKRALKIKIQVDGKTIDGYTLNNTVSEAVRENGVMLSRLDKTTPELNDVPQNNLTIVVTRINEEIKTIPEDIPFKTTTKLDNTLGWREKNISTPGENGIREVTYKITYKNGKEITRVALSKNITKDPVTQIETQGTFVKVGKADKGQGTWYSNQGGMFAASLTIPRGGYARVTNTANGKSVMVQINDSGPYGKGRIIDLDKPAFQKIADIGAGVIGVKVEEVLN
jgi:uncharacterized protein YabE (DUF348 family)